MASQEERKRIIEEKKAALLAAKKKKEQGEAQEDSVMQRAMALAQDSTQNSTAATEDSNASTMDQSAIIPAKAEVHTEIFTIPTIYSRLPKPKVVMKDAEVQADLDIGPGEGNVENEKNQPDNHIVGNGAGGTDAKADVGSSEHVVQKISAASMIQRVTRVYTRDEQQKLFESEKFDRFIRQASKFVDHVLSKKLDIFSMSSPDDSKQPEKAEKVAKVVRTFQEQLEDEKAEVVQTLPCLPKVEDCMIADLQWNDAIPDLLLVNYAKRNREDDKFTNYPGRVMLWSANNNTRPEFILSSKNRVTKARFDPYNPALVYGGCHNGEVLLWDARVSGTPVTTIHPSNDSHFTPIYGLSLVCVWEPHNLSNPTLQVNITAPKAENPAGRATVEQNVALMPMTMAVPPGHFSKIFLAGFEKTAYNVNLNQQQNNGNQIIQTFSDQGHSGPICGLSYLTNYSGKHSTNSGMLLTSSFDWTVKLWYPQLTERCLATFTEHQSVVSDVCWNSMHPAKFASCSAEGELFIWNLFRSSVLPVYRHKSNGTCMTKLDWNMDGRHLAVGDTEGRVTILKQKKVANQYDEEDEKKFKEKINAIATKELSQKVN